MNTLPEMADPALRRRLEILATLYGNSGFIDGYQGYLAEIVVEDTLRIYGDPNE